MSLKFIIDPAPATSPHRPHVRAGVARVFNAYTVPGVATVEGWPWRSMTDARAIARRLYLDPASYLPVVATFNVPGVTFDRAARRAA